MHNIKILDDNVVIIVKGELGIKNAKILHDIFSDIAQLENKENYNYIWDLSGVHKIDSSGIGLLTLTIHIIQKKNKKLMICGINSSDHRVYKLARINQHVCFYDTIEDALNLSVETQIINKY